MSEINDRGARFAANTLFGDVGLAQQSFPTGALYIVGLPIGNAADVTLRALWILDICDVIACEDTRETKKLLDRYSIHTPTVSVREHNERTATEALLDKLAAGARVALVTDAGTPAVSDPGARAVDTVRQAGFTVVPVPGACAAVTALSASGLDSYTFTFVGFVPPTAKARKETIATYAARSDAFILYEAPHRLKDLIKDLAAALDPERRVVVARELTKRFETFECMKAQELPAWIADHEPKGEYAIVVDMHRGKNQGLTEDDMKWVRELVKELPLSRAAAVTAKVTGIKRDEAYQLLSKVAK